MAGGKGQQQPANLPQPNWNAYGLQGYDQRQDWSPYPQANVPGGYQQQPLGGGIASGPLGMLSPWLGMGAQMFGLDRRVMQSLVPNAVSMQGNLFGQTNAANAMMNQALNSQYSKIGFYDDKARQRDVERTLGGIYRTMGDDPATAKTNARAARGNLLNPFTLAATALVGANESSQMQANMANGAFYTGAMNYTRPGALQGFASNLTPAEQKLAYGRNKGATGDEQERDFASGIDKQQDAIKRAHKSVYRDYNKNFTQYGGLSGGQVGSLTAEMERSGSVTFDGSQSTGQIKNKIKQMSQALGPLKELFGGDIPKLVDQLDKAFGTNALATFSPAQMQSKALQMKHTAAITGTSVQNLGQMIGASQAMLAGVGIGGQGAFQAAMDTATMTSGPGSARVNQEQFKAGTLKRNVALQEHYATKMAAGAYTIWAGRQKGPGFASLTDAQKMAQFQAEFGAGAMDEASMAKRLGVSQSDIVRAAGSREADDARRNTDLGVFVGNKKFMGRYEDLAKRHTLNTISKGVLRAGASALTAKDIEGKSRDEVVALMGARYENSGQLAGDLDRRLDNSARMLGLGKNHDEAEQLRKGYKNKKLMDAEVSRRSGLEKLTQEVGSAFGMQGVLKVLNESKGGGNEVTIGKFIAGTFGMMTADELEKAKRSGNMTAVDAKARAAAADMKAAAKNRGGVLTKSQGTAFDKMADAAMRGSTEGGMALDSSEETKKWRDDMGKMLLNKNAKAAELQALVDKGNKLGVTNEAKKANEIGGGDKDRVKEFAEKTKALSAEYTKAANNPATKEADLQAIYKKSALMQGAEAAGVDAGSIGSIEAAYKKMGPGASMSAIYEEAGVKGDQLGKATSAAEGAASKLGVSPQSELSMLIEKILAAITNAVNQLTTKKP